MKTLLADVPAVDTILFEHDSRWWMLTTIQGQGPALNNAELHAYYADDPLGDWRPHAQNPIVMDAGKGRNGGFVRDKGGRPCRVAQRPGFTFYGAGSAVYRIDELTPDSLSRDLAERSPAELLPEARRDPPRPLRGRDDRLRLHARRTAASEAEEIATSLFGSREVDAPRGFEPRLTESESVVLPLDDGAAWEAGGIESGALDCQRRRRSAPRTCPTPYNCD